jgi:hypothetical protein
MASSVHLSLSISQSRSNSQSINTRNKAQTSQAVTWNLEACQVADVCFFHLQLVCFNRYAHCCQPITRSLHICTYVQQSQAYRANNSFTSEADKDSNNVDLVAPNHKVRVVLLQRGKQDITQKQHRSMWLFRETPAEGKQTLSGFSEYPRAKSGGGMQ